MTARYVGLHQLVSKANTRTVEDGFDLDLAYVTPRIVAMGAPVVGDEAYFRNPLEDVCRFLEQRHSEKYLVFNLCLEKQYQYSPSCFHNRVEFIPVADHTPPSLNEMAEFCGKASAWLDKLESHCVVVHCKAGRGRTALMVCALLLFTGVCGTPQESLQLYGKTRSQTGKSISFPSQRRQLYYFYSLLKRSDRDRVAFVSPPRTSISICQVRMRTFPVRMLGKASHFRLDLEWRSNDEDNGSSVLWTSGESSGAKWVSLVKEGSGYIVFGEFALKLFEVLEKKERLACAVYSHASFLPEKGNIRWERHAIDWAHKDALNRQFDPRFALEMAFKAEGEDSIAFDGSLDWAGTSQTIDYLVDRPGAFDFVQKRLRQEVRGLERIATECVEKATSIEDLDRLAHILQQAVARLTEGTV